MSVVDYKTKKASQESIAIREQQELGFGFFMSKEWTAWLRKNKLMNQFYDTAPHYGITEIKRVMDENRPNRALKVVGMTYKGTKEFFDRFKMKRDADARDYLY